MLRTIGVNLDDCFKSNVFSRQPSGNNLALYGVDGGGCSPQSRSLGPLTLNPITYIADEHLHELDRLRSELAACNPNVVIALGNTASWALLGQQGINNLRGSVHVSHFLGPDRPLKVVPTYHPAAVLRQWDQRVIAIADLEKAHAESHSPEFQYDNTELWLNPTLADLHEFHRLHLANAEILSTDVETKRGQITCLSFSATLDHAIVIPFWLDGPNPNYWPTVEAEHAAWEWVRALIESPTPKVMQNGLYDTQYFARHGITVRNFLHDTMHQHHSLFSELKKGLGFLGSIYANTPSWKMMRNAITSP